MTHKTKSEDYFKAITQNSSDIIIIVDRKGTITYTNDAVQRFLGYKPEELVGKSGFSFIMPYDRPRAIYDFGKAILTKDMIISNTFGVRHKDGSERILEGVGNNLLDNPVVSGFVMNVRDVTKRKKAEEELRLYRQELEKLVEERTSELEQINSQLLAELTERRRMERRLLRAEKMESLGTMAGGVAHDLNNLLGVLVGCSELLLIETPEEHRHRKHISNILQSGKRAATIIQDLLTLTRRGVAVSEVVNLNEVLSEYLNAPEFEKLKMYHTQVVFKPSLEQNLLNIKGSPIHLGKTIMNLVSNAAEAISGPGEVTIRTENCYLDKPVRGYDDVHEGDYVRLTVTDNGKGISAVDMEKIFEPFYTKKVMGRSGTGLGLTVVWGTVKDHGGYIDVQSRDGEGSVFAVYIPATREETTGVRREVSLKQYMGCGESILVVDDIKEQREMATQILTKLGYRVHAVSGGEEAVAYLKSHTADLLVLDMIMDPGIDGLETYRRVIEINPRQKTVIVSGFSETARVKAAQKLGAGAYVQKPYVMEKIGLAIRGELMKGPSEST